MNFLYHRLARCMLNLELEVRLKWAPHRNSGGSGRTPSVCRHKTSHHGDWNYQEVSKAFCFSTSMFWKILLNSTFDSQGNLSASLTGVQRCALLEVHLHEGAKHAKLKKANKSWENSIPISPTSFHSYIIYIYILLYRHPKSQLLKFRIFMISAHSANPRLEEASPESM